MKLFNLSILWILSLACAQVGFSQSIKNVNAQFDGQNMIITYELSAASASDKFKVQLFSSHDNYQKPISFVTGGVGDNIGVGSQISVTWALTNELPSTFNDYITIKVKAIAIIANFTMKPLASNAFKRGGNLQLNWEGGTASDQIKLELLKDNVVQKTISTAKNTHAFAWQIPKNNKSGNYTLKISNAVNANINAISQPFKIKPKIPMLAKIGVPVLIGVLVGVLAGGGSSEPSTTTNGLSDLPGPITPPSGG